MPSICDYLIVGGGIAGLTLASYFEDKDLDFLIVNKDLPGAASKVSSGLINPITGMRLVLSWNYEELKNEFLQYYHSLETKLNEKLIHESQLTQLLNSSEEQNVWLSRTADPLYGNYFQESNSDVKKYLLLNSFQLTGEIKPIYIVKINKLLSLLENRFKQTNQYIDDYFEFSDVYRTKTELKWKNLKISKAIIFAEGHRVNLNPFFNWIPVVPLKGECLQIEMENMDKTTVFKEEYSLVHFDKNSYWCGSNFDLKNTSLNITEKEKNRQLEFLKKNFRINFHLMQHSFGIRPASRDRRPIVGHHPEDSRLIVFNGLGTKGLSLAPYCAGSLIEFLLRKKTIPKEIAVSRLLAKGYIPTALD